MNAILLFAALAATILPARQEAAVPEASSEPAAATGVDANGVANALSGPTLTLTMRGTTVQAIADVTPTRDGCTAVAAAHAPGKHEIWSREFRWGDVAWLGPAPDGRTRIAFFESEGRLPTDMVTFAPAEPGSFRAALARMADVCRVLHRDSERIAFGATGPMRSCYFPHQPALQLIDSGSSEGGLPPRAMLSVLSRENPQAELQLLLERAVPRPSAGDDDWGNPIVAFVFADPRVKEMQIAAARFSLDAKPVAAQHAVASYGETRVRIIMDPFAASSTGTAKTSFYRRLKTSDEVTLTLLDKTGRSHAVLSFDAGPGLAAAREALSAADWSCATASPALTPAALWQPVNATSAHPSVTGR